jgi:hypothetical protein
MEGKIIDLHSKAPITPEPLPAISRRRRERIERVFNMWLEGAKTLEIAQFFGLSIRQVQKDVQDAKVLARALIRDWDSESALVAEIKTLQRLRWLAMREFSLAKFESNKLGALRLAADVSSRLIALLQSVGLINRVPERILVEENVFCDPEIRRKFTGMLLEIRKSGEKIPGIDF